MGEHDDAGFGLVEIMVSMVIFGLVAVAAVPLFISSVQVSARNASIAHASQLVNQGLEVARSAAVTGSCDVITQRLDAIPDSTDARGIPFEVHTEMTGCTPGVSSLATVKVWTTTTSAGFGDPVATATTRVHVKLVP